MNYRAIGQRSSFKNDCVQSMKPSTGDNEFAFTHRDQVRPPTIGERLASMTSARSYLRRATKDQVKTGNHWFTDRVVHITNVPVAKRIRRSAKLLVSSLGFPQGVAP